MFMRMIHVRRRHSKAKAIYIKEAIINKPVLIPLVLLGY
jgi:hypothetical protein